MADPSTPEKPKPTAAPVEKKEKATDVKEMVRKAQERQQQAAKDVQELQKQIDAVKNLQGRLSKDGVDETAALKPAETAHLRRAGVEIADNETVGGAKGKVAAHITNLEKTKGEKEAEIQTAADQIEQNVEDLNPTDRVSYKAKEASRLMKSGNVLGGLAAMLAAILEYMYALSAKFEEIRKKAKGKTSGGKDAP
ncbi:MAG: hypothetical protein WCX61_05090, partial [Candidatus Peribacteraceae bacterium]